MKQWTNINLLNLLLHFHPSSPIASLPLPLPYLYQIPMCLPVPWPCCFTYTSTGIPCVKWHGGNPITIYISVFNNCIWQSIGFANSDRQLTWGVGGGLYYAPWRERYKFLGIGLFIKFDLQFNTNKMDYLTPLYSKVDFFHTGGPGCILTPL